MLDRLAVVIDREASLVLDDLTKSQENNQPR